jgi:hypothetical protein
MMPISATADQPDQSKPLRLAAQVFSYLLHPLFIPLVVAWLLLYQHPVYSLVVDPPSRLRLIAMIGLVTLFFPAFVVFLLWRLKFISNIYLETQRERIIPLNISIIFYFWAFYVVRNLDVVPPALLQWLMGVFITSSAALFTNIFFKISLHALGFGGLIAFMGWQLATDPHWPRAWLLAALLLGGMVGTARLIKKAHQPSEVYAGYLAGVICQIAAGIASGM